MSLKRDASLTTSSKDRHPYLLCAPIFGNWVTVQNTLGHPSFSVKAQTLSAYPGHWCCDCLRPASGWSWDVLLSDDSMFPSLGHWPGPAGNSGAAERVFGPLCPGFWGPDSTVGHFSVKDRNAKRELCFGCWPPLLRLT